MDSKRLEDLKRMRRIRDRIDREFAEPLNLELLAAAEGISAGHLSRQFRDAYLETPYQYLMTRRIERAKALLRAGRLNVTETCFTVGFSSLGTFTSRFSELVGMSPSAYRDLNDEAAARLPACIARRVTRPVRNREAD